MDKSSRPFVWIFWQYINGSNLKENLDNSPSSIDIAFIENLTKTILEALYAFNKAGFPHGDLHEGNILISNPNPLAIGNPREIWITDFGYGGSHNELEPKDDYRQLFSIISTLLKRLTSSNLNPRDRILYDKMNSFLSKKLMETDHTQGVHVRNPEVLLEEFKKMSYEAENEAALATKGEDLKGVADYLVAEALGYRIEEWKNLFVPDFLAALELLSKNITMLTGARGCGKTMIFRRLTAYMDKIIDESSGVKGADQFIGFYLNCRDIVETFPWIPQKLKRGMKEQIIHYFNLSWFNEICKTLALYSVNGNENFDWLDGFMSGIFGEKYQPLPHGSNILAHTQAFLGDEKEMCRVTDFGKVSGIKNWPLSRTDFLDILQPQLQTHVLWLSKKPIYLFLDDYTTPIITKEVQHTLNPIIFKRRSDLFFKISTESANSFEPVGLRGKPLELHHDFELIDLATESLYQDDKGKTILLEDIFKRRIDRHPSFKGTNLGLKDILGERSFTNNKLATQMRDENKKIYYYGIETFIGMWTSDIRTLIEMFTDILREANGKLKNGIYNIDKTIQNKCCRSHGGEFLEFTEALKNPDQLHKRKGEKYGKSLRDIVEAFVNVSRYELTKGNLVSNQGRLNPKQAFRIEILDKFEPSDNVLEYHKGLIRWHIFLQDWRGKSQRGMFTPRMYLNRILIPYCNLTFSSHDHIQLTNKEFSDLLTKPKEFINYWKKKRKKKRKKKEDRQGELGLSVQREEKS